MLAVAALLHLEAANLPGETQAWQARGDKPISSEFKEAAVDRLDAVIQASLASSDNLRVGRAHRRWFRNHPALQAFCKSLWLNAISSVGKGGRV